MRGRHGDTAFGRAVVLARDVEKDGTTTPLHGWRHVAVQNNDDIVKLVIAPHFS